MPVLHLLSVCVYAKGPLPAYLIWSKAPSFVVLRPHTSSPSQHGSLGFGSLSPSVSLSHTHARTCMHTHMQTLSATTLYFNYSIPATFTGSFLLFLRSGFENTQCLEGICVNTQFHEHDGSLFNCSWVSL